jgi:hypothetical protein
VTTTDDTSTQTGSTISRRRRSSTSTSRTSRTRRPRPSGDELLAQLTAQIDRLITENRELKRALAKAQHAAGGGLGQAGRALAGLQRRVSQALASSGSGRGGRAAEPAAAPKPRRKVTDPEVLERRRAALAKARAARAAKRAAGGGG